MAVKTVDLNIGGYPFVCVALANANFKDVAAVYVILCVDENSKWEVIDVGQSGELGDRIDSHDRKTCWRDNCPSKNIWVCVYRMPTDKFTKRDRLEVERSIRNKDGPLPCGEK